LCDGAAGPGTLASRLRSAEEGSEVFEEWPGGGETRPRADWATVPVPMDRVSRRERLEARVRQHLARGYRVEVRTEFTASLVKGGRLDHDLHLLLTMISFGAWAVVWAAAAALRGERRVRLTE
jgi:hypothetical protein